MNTFDKAFQKTMQIEGRYSNHKDDPGGATKFGITQETAYRLGYEKDISKLTLEEAKELYKDHYWTNQKYHKIENENIAIEMFDQAVNMGPATANKNLQKSYNLLAVPLGKEQIAEDGVIGPNTLRAVNALVKQTALFNLLNGYQIMNYINLAEARDNYKTFLAGWINKRIEIIKK